MSLRPEEKRVVIDATLALPLGEFEETYIRASGPGGQHVNKSSTAVQLRFNVPRSASLNDAVRQRLIAICGNRLTHDGDLIITAQRFRSREQNRHDAYERLARLVRRALRAPKKRKPTKPSRAARRRRLDDKKRRGAVKRLRGRPRDQD